MRRTTPGLLTILALVVALLVACGGGPVTAVPSAAPSISASTAASAAPSTAPSSAASGAVAVTRAATTVTTGAATPAATATRAATPATGGPPPKVTGALTIFAASSLTDAFNELKAAIEAANPGTRLTFNFAASSALRTQLEQGAKADLFASADTTQMGAAQRSNLISGDPTIFVRNTPVIIAPANGSRRIDSAADLAGPGIKLVLAAKEVPIGNYARQILDKMSQDPTFGADFGTRALANLVSEEANVRQVVAKVQLGEGDAGIVYASDITPAIRSQFTIIAIPERVNVIAEYPIATIRGGGNEAGARAFIAYLLSAEGQATLGRWGFVTR
jgi:molybdate transport system substrate-binding protein